MNKQQKLKKNLDEHIEEIKKNPFITHKVTWLMRLCGTTVSDEDIYIRRANHMYLSSLHCLNENAKVVPKLWDRFLKERNDYEKSIYPSTLTRPIRKSKIS